MRKFQVLVISTLFLWTNVNASFLQSPQPYAFGPEGRTMSDLRSFASPSQVADILPSRPVAATDSSGARTYFVNGRQMFSVSKDGQTTFSIGGVTKTRDKEGNIISISEKQNGTNISVVKDAFGEVTGFKTTNANGLTDKEFDAEGNLTRSYYYDTFGKTVTAVVNELTQEKTLYDSFGREKGTIAMGFGGDGYVISTCQYDDVSYERTEDGKSIIEVANTDKKVDAKLLVTKKSYIIEVDSLNGDGSVNISSGYNTIYYDKEGLISKVVNNHGITISEYFYNKDKYGNKVLTHVLTPQTKSITYYENGKPVEERNDMGGLTKKYYYDGSRLLYTVAMASDGSFGDVTYYDKAGKALSTTLKHVQYDPSSNNNKIDYVCGAEYAVKIDENEVDAIKKGISSLVEGRDYVIRTEINQETSEQEKIYYLVPNGIEGVNYVKKEVKNDSTGENETRFYTITEKYKYDAKGNIDYVINLTNNTRTYYKNNKMYYTAANDSSTEGINVSENPNDPRLLKVFAWDVDLDYENADNPATTLRYVYDTQSKTTQWFNTDSQFVYLTYNDRVVSNNIYDGGKLAGTWNNQTKELTILRDEKQWITVKMDSEPGVDFIRKVLSFTSGNTVDWDSVNSYIDYYSIREKVLEKETDLYKSIDTFEKYKIVYNNFYEQKKSDKNLSFMEYLKTL